MPFIHQPPPPDASLELLRQAWTEALFPGPRDKYLTVVTSPDQTQVLGVIQNDTSVFPELHLHVNPYYSQNRLDMGIKEGQLDPANNLDSLTALLNLQRFRRQPDDLRGGQIDFFMNQLGLRLINPGLLSSEPFRVGYIAGPQRDHSAAFIYISPASQEVKQLIGRGREPDTIINFAAQIQQHLGLDLTPHSTSAFDLECQQLFQG